MPPFFCWWRLFFSFLFFFIRVCFLCMGEWVRPETTFFFLFFYIFSSHNSLYTHTLTIQNSFFFHCVRVCCYRNNNITDRKKTELCAVTLWLLCVTIYTRMWYSQLYNCAGVKKLFCYTGVCVCGSDETTFGFAFCVCVCVLFCLCCCCFST